ncbi:hypothetical protein NGA_0504700, partial [Nannochloropsis gaditana CCMP526]|uniref:uncharacterized protein n=1 Tax=Nannochloropsis gaditana (strain CCMP526) TaxID=1093141 RepID=UPI00029F77DA
FWHHSFCIVPPFYARRYRAALRSSVAFSLPPYHVPDWCPSFLLPHPGCCTSSFSFRLQVPQTHPRPPLPTHLR